MVKSRKISQYNTKGDDTMPMSFPDMASLKRAAEVHKFRLPEDDEPEDDYRKELADHVLMTDSIESMEIRSGKGWDRWDSSEQREGIRRTMFKAPPGTLGVIDNKPAL
jgi:hypothetical protein